RRDTTSAWNRRYTQKASRTAAGWLESPPCRRTIEWMALRSRGVARSSCRCQDQRKSPFCIDPPLGRRPTARQQQSVLTATVELVAVLGVDRFSLRHGHRAARHIERDRLDRFQVHLYPRVGVVPASDMAQFVQRNGAAELPIDPTREVEVEFGRDAARVVISSFQDGHLLDQIHTDHKMRVRPAGLTPG